MHHSTQSHSFRPANNDDHRRRVPTSLTLSDMAIRPANTDDRNGPITKTAETRFPSTLDEHKAIFSLVYKTYLKVEAQLPHTSNMRFSFYDLLPQAQRIMRVSPSKLGEIDVADIQVTATFTKHVPEDGLPLSKMYPDIAKELPRTGAVYGESTMFAGQGNPTARTVSIFSGIVSWARESGCTHILQVINPEHVGFWMKSANFFPIVDVRDLYNPRPLDSIDVQELERKCPHVQGKGGILICKTLDFADPQYAARDTKFRSELIAKHKTGLAEHLEKCAMEQRNFPVLGRVADQAYSIFHGEKQSRLTSFDVADLLSARPEIWQEMTVLQRERMEGHYKGITTMMLSHQYEYRRRACIA